MGSEMCIRDRSPPTPIAPSMPAAATQHTKAGAEAFVRHYIDLINHAQATGDTQALRSASSPTCRGCSGGIKAVAKVYDRGGKLIGGEWTPQEVLNVMELPGHRGWLLDVTVRNSSQRVVAADGSERKLKAAEQTYSFQAHHRSETWLMDELNGLS